MSSDTPPNPSIDRYRRQTCYRSFGEAGQCRLVASRVLVCGCGALGSVIAETLVRAGVGFVRVVDRDFLELDNLHRQVLFDEADVAAGLTKAAAAATHLRQINSQVEVEPVVQDVTHRNIHRLAGDVDLLLDGTDNFQTRYLLNDYALWAGKPWVYGGCIGAEGQTMTILPDVTPCLACVMPQPPPASAIPTCETAGVLGPIVNVIASLQAMEGIKILSGHPEAINPGLTVIDLWHQQLRSVGLAALAERNNCTVCKQRDFAWLEGRRGAAAISLCGRNAVQISPALDSDIAPQSLQLEELARKLRPVGQVTSNPFLVRLAVEEYVISIFADGRAIVSGTDDIAVARAVHARYVGA
jgi:adenylyltransferase/sulfurtransferase